jgi:hypothetical protein
VPDSAHVPVCLTTAAEYSESPALSNSSRRSGGTEVIVVAERDSAAESGRWIRRRFLATPGPLRPDERATVGQPPKHATGSAREAHQEARAIERALRQPRSWRPRMSNHSGHVVSWVYRPAMGAAQIECGGQYVRPTLLISLMISKADDRLGSASYILPIIRASDGRFPGFTGVAIGGSWPAMCT